MINLFKIKPFLDEFQSCYKDKYRWYSGVYFVIWIVIIGIQGLPDYLLYTQTLFFILLCTQFLIKPYKNKLLNITDTQLLVDLNFLIALLYNKINDPQSSQHTFSSLIIHALIIVPFVCAVLFLIYLIFVKYGVYNCIKEFWSRRKRELELQQPQEVEHVSHPEVPVKKYMFLMAGIAVGVTAASLLFFASSTLAVTLVFLSSNWLESLSKSLAANPLKTPEQVRKLCRYVDRYRDNYVDIEIIIMQKNYCPLALNDNRGLKFISEIIVPFSMSRVHNSYVLLSMYNRGLKFTSEILSRPLNSSCTIRD